MIMIITINMINIKEHKTYDSLRKVMIHWGFGDLESAVYALLVMNRKPMSAKDIADELGYAYSSVVNALNQLRRHQLVERAKAGKCYVYSAVIDFVRIIKNERARVKNFLTEAKSALEEENGEYAELLKHLEEGIEYLGHVEKEVK